VPKGRIDFSAPDLEVEQLHDQIDKVAYVATRAATCTAVVFGRREARIHHKQLCFVVPHQLLTYSFTMNTKIKAIVMPLFKLVASLCFLVVAGLITTAVLSLVDIKARIDDEMIRTTVQYCATAPMILLAYVAYVKLVERRNVIELGRSRWLPEFGLGYLYGVLIMSFCVVAAMLFGVLRFDGANITSAIPMAFLLTLAIGVVEEIIFRGILFRIAEETFGSWVAIVLSAAFFGFSHITNENATLFASVAIALEAGLLLAAAYMLTRRLWLVIGIHAAWNFTQGAVFGIPVSGISIEGMFSAELSGPELLSGGAFGLEGSLIAVIICTVCGLLFLRSASQKGNIIPPPWMRAPAFEPDASGEQVLNAPLPGTQHIDIQGVTPESLPSSAPSVELNDPDREG
jgi:CAAX protease family protein